MKMRTTKPTSPPNTDDSSFFNRTAALGGEFVEELIPRSRIPREIRELICGNEKVLFADNPSKTILYLRLILSNSLQLPLTVGGVINIFRAESLLDLAAGILALLLVALTNYWICVSWKQTFYVITTSRLIARAGFFNRRIKVAPIRNVQEISVNTGWIDRWLHLNTVHFATAANTFLRIAGGVGVTFKSVQSRTVMRAFQTAS
ncbi:PH domain-containing protein [Maioricimonas sp. JC845]|uniref:PH domain-containing protein n=1 Tax=Maioricimonas sp. JC845 TaxID=3232138 RepID=UPI0034586BA5